MDLMADTVFAFGQRGGYHFECPSKWHLYVTILSAELAGDALIGKSGLLPEKVQELFKTKQIASVYCLRLGAADSFFISYSGKDGRDHICRSLPDSSSRPTHQRKIAMAYQ